MRYLVVDSGDPRMRADPHYPLFRKIREDFELLESGAGDSELEVYALW